MSNELTRKAYRSNYFYRLLKKDFNPFRPNHVIIDEADFQFKKRSWFLMSHDTQTHNFQHISGIDVNSHLFGATLLINTTGNDTIVVWGLSKKNAKEIREHCLKFINANSRRTTTEILKQTIVTTSQTSTEAIVSSNNNKNSGGLSVADELKKLKELLDNGIITQQEFDTQKSKLI